MGAKRRRASDKITLVRHSSVAFSSYRPIVGVIDAVGCPGVLTHTLIDDEWLSSDLSVNRECLTAGILLPTQVIKELPG